MSRANTILEKLVGLNRRAHGAQIAELDAVHHAQMGQAVVDNVQRAQRQAEHQFKQCNPDYEPPEGDDVGNTIYHISGNVMTNAESLAALLKNETMDSEVAGEESSQPSVPSQDGAGTAGRGVSSGVRPSAGRADPGTGRSDPPTTRPARPVGISGKLDGLLDRIPKWLKLLAGVAAAGGFLWWNEARRPTHAVLTGNELFEVIESEVTTVEGELDVRN